MKLRVRELTDIDQRQLFEYDSVLCGHHYTVILEIENAQLAAKLILERAKKDKLDESCIKRDMELEWLSTSPALGYAKYVEVSL